jgi:hypothetical protein
MQARYWHDNFLKLQSLFNLEKMKRISPAIFSMLTACSSVVYMPNSHNVPTFSGKKEFQGNASAQISLPVFFLGGLQVQSAYSFTSHIGAIANYSYSQNFFSKYVTGHLGELGIGYYTNSKKNYFGAFLGYGISSFQDDRYEYIYKQFYKSTPPPGLSQETASRVQSDYRSLFLMPSYAVRKKFITLIGSIKISHVDFENTYFGSGKSLAEYRPNSYHFEPAFTIKLDLGHGPFSFIGQVGAHFTNDTSLQAYSNFLFRGSAGFQWKLDLKKKKSD